ncbi:MAG TPA: DUF2071 domain-containing protein [Verrucomicrobiae bacterium]
MNAIDVEQRVTINLSNQARARMLSLPGEPLFIADWVGLFFLHFEVNAEALQSEVPFPLDLYEGRAFVSLVSFQLERLRLFKAPSLTETVLRPFTRSHFLNVRAYVTHRGEPGIYFMQEFLSNKLSIPFGRPAYGLPYHHAAADRRIDDTSGHLDLRLCGENRQAFINAALQQEIAPKPCEDGSLAEFLLERYTAYTCHCGVKRRFRIWHPVWEQRAVEFQLHDEGLLKQSGAWFIHAQPGSGHLANIAKDVWMGRPVIVS